MDRKRAGLAAAALSALLAALPARPAAAQPAPQPAPRPAAAAPADDPQENLTVLGHRRKFETAPMPGAELGPPPDKPGPHLGRYKVTGDQERRDGHDSQTGAFVAPFGSAYTGSSPVADGLASRFGH